MMEKSYAKFLTRNDLGLTGGHQGGICVPRADKALLDFFPRLDEGEINPETWIECKDEQGAVWKLRYIYYNGKLHDTSTRNEYRITYMTKFLRESGAMVGDAVVFTSMGEPATFKISIKKNTDPKNVQEEMELGETKVIVLKGWSRIH